MAYYYVKSGGTAATATDNGRYATQQTGTFSGLGTGGYYDNIVLALTALTPIAAGDYVMVSDIHSWSNGPTNSVAYIGVSPSVGQPTYMISVDDVAIDTEKAATAYQEEMGDTTSAKINFAGSWVVRGMYFLSAEDIATSGVGSGTTVWMYNCTLELGATDGDSINVDSSSTSMYLEDCTILNQGTAYSGVSISQGCKAEFKNCTFIDEVAFGWANTGGSGGSTLLVTGCDLSASTQFLVNDGGSSRQNDDLINFRFHNCKMNAGVQFWNETVEGLMHELLVTNSAATGPEAEYQYRAQRYAGIVEDNDTTYRDNSTAFPSGQKVSLKAITDSNASRGFPFFFDYPTGYAELSGVLDTERIHLVSSVALYDSDVWVELIYMDRTSAHQPNSITTRHGSILDTNGTVLATSTEAWTLPPATPNYYQIDIDTSVDPGSDCVPTIRMYVAKASATIYFCPTLGLS